ncbi:MAG: tetratricopeptide repeat protein [Ignavibacteriales bacterium]|nr:tetratricopeptide repeat protein [Ignavibacteriales bacterium]
MKNKALLIFLFLLITVVATNKIVDNKTVGHDDTPLKKSDVATTLPGTGNIENSETKNENDSLSALFNRAFSAFDSAKYNVAINIWHSILGAYETEKDYQNLVIATNNIAVAYNNMKKFDLALDYFTKAKNTAKKYKLHKYVDTYTDNLIYYYEEYLIGFKTREVIVDAIDYFTKESQQTYLTKFQEKLQEHDELLKVAEKAISGWEIEKKSTTDKNRLSYLTRAIADDYLYTGKIVKAKEFYLESLKLAQSGGSDSSVAKTMAMLTNLEQVARHLKNDEYVNLWRVESPEQSVKVFYFTDIQYISSDSLIATVSGGKYDNIIAGSAFDVWACVYPELAEHDVFSLGKGRVTEVGNYDSKVGVKLFTGDNPQKKVFIVDHAYIPVAKKQGYNSDLAEVARLEIIFRDNQNSALYTFNLLNYISDLAVEEKLLSVMLNDFVPLHSFIEELVQNDPEYGDEAVTGEFKGKTIAEAIKASTLETTKNFLMFVKDFPAKYLGLTFKFVESYFSWIYSDAIGGQTKIAKLVLKSKDEKELRKIFETDSASIVEYDIVGKFADSTDELYPLDSMEKAGKYSLAASLFADWMKNSDKIKRAYLSRGLYLKSMEDYTGAESAYLKSLVNAHVVNDSSYMATDVYSKMGNHQKSLDIYDKVYELSKLTGNKAKEASGLFDKAYSLFELGDYIQAMDYYERSYNIYIAMDDYDNAGLCYSNIGQALWNLGKFKEAIEAHNKAIEYRKKTGNLSDQAFSYDKVGSLYSKQGDPDKAIEYFTKAVELYKTAKNDVGMASVYDNIGAMYKKLKDFEKTFEYFKMSLAVKEKANDKYAIAENYFEQGLAYMEFNDAASAQEVLKKSYELNMLVNDKMDAIYCMINLGQIQYGFRNNFDTALTIFNSALLLAKEIANNSPIAYCFKQLGLLYSEKGESSTSIKYLDSALTIYEKMQEKSEIGNLFISLGSASISGGEFDKAMNYYTKAETVAREMNNNTLLGDVYLYKGDLYRVQGEYKKAMAIFDTAYSYYNTQNNPWALASIYISYGNVFNVMGEYQKSVYNYGLADSIYTELKNDYYRATPLNNMGTVYFWQGDYHSSLPFFQKALSILDSVKYFGDFRATVLTNIGEINYELKNYDEAEKVLLSAIEHARKIGAKTHLPTPYGLLASIYIDTKKYAESEKWAKMAYDLSTELKDRNDILYSSLVLGRLNYINNNIPVSNKFLDQSIAVAEELGTNKLVYHSYYYKALNFQTESKSDSSLKYLKKAVNVLSDIRGKLVGGDKAAKMFSSGDMKVKIYEAIINAFIQKGQLDSALYYLDMSYNEGLKEQFGGVTPKFEDKTQNEAIEKEKELKNKKSGLEEELQKEKSKPAELQNTEKIASLSASLEVAENSYVEFIMNTVQRIPASTIILRII